ncbi:MAG: DUF1003 domain-containing protein [Candidatus Eremiobacteraeota bacterium]|nr:DUF1003 domain-containing protein [Candidatus Eremiobacteraeota bacterium]
MTTADVPLITPSDHPLLHNVNQDHLDQLSPIEKFCKRIADATGAPIALMLAILLQFIWIIVGTLTHFDPYPFAFLLTISNIVQLILIFIIAVAQKQSSQHAELRAQHDHEAISRLLYHQEVQERILIAIATKTELDVEAIKGAVLQLAQEDSG